MRKEYLFFILFCFAIILNLGFISSAKNISVVYPNNISSGQIFYFNTTLLNFSEGIYDIKIDFINSSSDRISEMYNGSTWRSTNYYFYNATNTSSTNSSSFLMNITSNYNGTANISINVRKSGSTSYDVFQGYTINITPQIIIPVCIQNWNCSAWSSCSSNTQSRTCSDVNNCGNTTGKPETTQSCDSSDSSEDISLELDWNEDDIVNGNEFDVDVKALNLAGDNYDLKVWIQFQNNETIISERKDDLNDEWKSGNYYVENFFSGTGDKTKSITLRIKESYNDFKDDAEIWVKLRKTGSSSVIAEKSEDITVKEKKEQVDSSKPKSDTVFNTKPEETATDSVLLTGSSIIILGSKENKTSNKNDNGIIYKSKIEYIKEYAPYVFSLVCIFIMVLLLIDKKK